MSDSEDMKITQDQAKAIIVLVQAVQIGQKRGAYDLNEASQISNAVNLFIKKEEQEKTPSSGANNPDAVVSNNTTL